MGLTPLGSRALNLGGNLGCVVKIDRVEQGGVFLAHVHGGVHFIDGRQAALDLMMGSGFDDISGFAVEKTCFHPDVFDLKTKIAGDIFQMVVNYQLRLAIIGDFSNHDSKSLQDFIRESNRRKQIIFVPDLGAAFEAFRPA